MAVKIEEWFSEATINKRIRELGEQIAQDYAGSRLKLICVLRGASLFYAELAKRISLPVRFDFISVSSYGDATSSGGQLKMRKDLDEPVLGEHVILVEDIVDTGVTLSELGKLVRERGAADVAIAALLDKPQRRCVDIRADYVGFTIPNEFVVGYGLDYQQLYRNLPYIGRIVE